jgi:hypothetical protein
VTDPRREASRVFRGIDGPAATPRRIAPPGAVPVPRGAATTAPADPSVSIGRAAVQTAVPGRAASTPVRFRDWNPDLRVARQLGVRIEYSSRRNEVRCPELGLSSSDRARPSGRVPRMTSHGISYGPATSVDGFSAGGSGSSNPAGSGPSEASGQAGSTSGRSQSDRGSAASGGKESKAGGESGKIKN